MNQITRKFPLLRPLMWVMIPPSIVLTMPTLLRLNHEEVKARITRRHALDHPDYMQSLIPVQDEDLPTDDWIFAQADQMMAASFDPLTNVLTASVFYLGMNPEKMARTVAEIRGSFEKYEDITAEGLQNCRYLTAVIDECMRIHTNAGFGLPRVSPGAVVDGYYVPKGVSNRIPSDYIELFDDHLGKLTRRQQCVVQTSHFSTTHDERFFHLAREFHPERFLPQAHPLYDQKFRADCKDAFLPFSLGKTHFVLGTWSLFVLDRKRLFKDKFTTVAPAIFRAILRTSLDRSSWLPRPSCRIYANENCSRQASLEV